MLEHGPAGHRIDGATPGSSRPVRREEGQGRPGAPAQTVPRGLQHADLTSVLQLQRLAGNRAVTGVVRPGAPLSQVAMKGPAFAAADRAVIPVQRRERLTRDQKAAAAAERKEQKDFAKLIKDGRRRQKKKEELPKPLLLPLYDFSRDPSNVAYLIQEGKPPGVTAAAFQLDLALYNALGTKRATYEQGKALMTRVKASSDPMVQQLLTHSMKEYVGIKTLDENFVSEDQFFSKYGGHKQLAGLQYRLHINLTSFYTQFLLSPRYLDLVESKGPAMLKPAAAPVGNGAEAPVGDAGSGSGAVKPPPGPSVDKPRGGVALPGLSSGMALPGLRSVPKEDAGPQGRRGPRPLPPLPSARRTGPAKDKDKDGGAPSSRPPRPDRRGALDPRLSPGQKALLLRTEAQGKGSEADDRRRALDKVRNAGIDPADAEYMLGRVVAYLGSASPTINLNATEGLAGVYEGNTGYSNLWHKPLPSDKASDEHKAQVEYEKVRNRIEQEVFGYGDDPRAGGDMDERPVYAGANLGNAVRGAAPYYGTSYFQLDDSVKDRSTYSHEDTFTKEADNKTKRVHSKNHLEGVVADMDVEKLKKIIKQASGDAAAVEMDQNQQVELHVHGGIDWAKDVKKLVLDESSVPKGSPLEARLLAFARTHGIQVEVYNATAWRDQALKSGAKAANVAEAPTPIDQRPERQKAEVLPAGNLMGAKNAYSIDVGGKGESKGGSKGKAWYDPRGAVAFVSSLFKKEPDREDIPIVRK